MEFTIRLDVFDIVECEFTSELFHAGGFSGGLNVGFAGLERMFGANCDEVENSCSLQGRTAGAGNSNDEHSRRSRFEI